jgi:hypothetical protein
MGNTIGALRSMENGRASLRAYSLVDLEGRWSYRLVEALKLVVQMEQL